MEPVRLEILLDDKTLKGMRSVEGNLSGIGLYAKQVIAQLEQELLELQKQYRNAMAAGTNTDAQMADIQALQGVIRQLKAELQGLEEQKKKTGSTPLMGDDPAPKLNNVRMSMQQIARELPSLAMGPQMFFLAISNNIPMFTDALSSARQEYEALTKAGKKATPVWKQVLSSLFSWQTALAALITLSVVYGKEIGGWVKSLFGVKDAALSAAKAQEKVNESFRNSSSDVAEQVTLVRSLSERWKELGDNMSDKKQFITENKKEFGKLGVEVGNVNDAENLLVDNTDVFIGAMILRAEAAAAFKLATEQTEKALKKQNEIEERRKKGPTFWDRFRANFFSSASGSATYTRQADAPTAEQLRENDISALEEEQKAAEDTAKSYMDLFLARTKEWKERLKSAGIKEDDGRETKDTGKSARDYQDELADARIRAQQKLEAARISVMQEGIRKRQALARQELDESLAQIDKEERDTLKKMDEAEKKRGVKSTPEERQAVRDNASQQRLVAYQQYAKEFYTADKEWQEKDLQSWIDYNREYGTYQQKRLAIMREYTLKSSKESLNGNDKRMLARQRDEALSELDFNELKDTINWDVVFGNLDKVAKKELQKVKRQIVSFRNSPEFKKSATPEQMQVIEEAIGKIDSEVIEKGGLFGNLTESIRVYSEAVDELTAAQRDYDEAVRQYGADSAEAEAARKKRNKAEAGERNAGNNLEASKDKAVRNITAVADAMNTLGEADMSLSSFGSAVGSLVDTLSASGSKIGGIIAAILAILDQIGQKGLEGFVGNILETVMHAAGGLWDSIGRLFGVKGLGGIFKGADYSGYNEMVDQYNRLNEIWDELIDKKKEYIETSYGAEAQKVGEEALTLQRTAIDSYRILGKERLNSGASTGSHSIGVRQRKWMSSQDWAAAGAALGEDFYRYGIGEGRMTGLFDLSVEQLEKLKSEAPTFWAKLDDDVRNYLDKIIDGSEKLGDIQAQIKEQLTQMSFDSMRDAFYDTLLDMESGAEDFSEDFSEYLQKAILKTSLSKVYDKRLQEWYDKFANYNKEGGIDTGEYKDLQQEWNNIVKDALEERDSLKDIFGWTSSSSSSQSGRAGTVTSMTEETAGRLEGIGNATLDHVISIDNNLTRHLEGMATSLGKIAGNSEYLRHLETINENIAELRRGVKLKT
nr:MAG TPA: tail tape measure protein [Caudoviricetes sp.]